MIIDTGVWFWYAIYAAVGLLIADIIYRWPRIPTNGKVVLVTGAGTGIAAQLCERLASECGVHVLAGCYFESEVKEWNEKWGGSGGGGVASSFAFRLDITDPASVDQSVEVTNEWCKRWGAANGLHALVNCAGVIDGVAVELTPQQVFERVMGVNCFGHIRMCKAFIRM